MFIVGITGGIGSGKSTVTDYLQNKGIDVVDADVAARVVVEPGTVALAYIIEHFGESIALADGTLDRADLRQRIFNNPDEKQWLEGLLHPLIGEEISRALGAATSPYVLFVSPLLIEAQQHLICDRVVVVDVPEATQIERTMARDDNDSEQVKKIIASQTSREQRLEKSTDVIENTAGLEELQQTADQLHQQFLAMAADKARQATETTQ